MKKFILCLMAVLLVFTSVYAADFSAGVKVDASGRSNFNRATDDYETRKGVYEYGPFSNSLYLAIKPYYTDGHFDVALKIEGGYGNDTIYQIEGLNGFYSFLNYDLSSVEGNVFDEFSVHTLAYISNYIDRLLFTAGDFQIGFVRDEQLDVTTLATGKYTKTPLAVLDHSNYHNTPEIAPETCQDLSAIVSYDFGEHSIYAFAERFDQVAGKLQNEFELYETFGAEIIVPSIFLYDMHYRASAIADLSSGTSSTQGAGSYFYVYPEFGFELNTTFGERKFDLKGAFETAFSFKKGLAVSNLFAGELNTNLTLGSFEIETDVYIVKDDAYKDGGSDNDLLNGKRPLFRNVTLYKKDTSGTDTTYEDATVLGVSVGSTYHFGKGHEVSFSTGVALDTANGFVPFEFDKYLTDANNKKNSYLSALTNLGTLDFLKLGVKFGDKAWFAADAEVNYFWYMLTGGISDNNTEPNFLDLEYEEFVGWANIVKASLSAGADLGDIDVEAKVYTGTDGHESIDLYGSFKCTVDIH